MKTDWYRRCLPYKSLLSPRCWEPVPHYAISRRRSNPHTERADRQVANVRWFKVRYETKCLKLVASSNFAFSRAFHLPTWMTRIAERDSLLHMHYRVRRPSAQCGRVIGGYLQKLAEGSVQQSREESSIVLDDEESGDNATFDKY